jgi:hypothetical protein
LLIKMTGRELAQQMSAAWFALPYDSLDKITSKPKLMGQVSSGLRLTVLQQSS